MPLINFTEKDQVGILTLNRPEKRNALNPELVNEIKIKLKEIKSNEKVQVLVVTGEGSSFCAGADLEYLNKIKDFSLADNENDSRSLAELFLMIYHFPKPTIAAVNGPAIAGGCGLASVCDFLIADEQTSKFGYTEVKIGFLASIVSIFLIKRVGYHKAKQLLLSGLIINPEEALKIGLVDYLSNNVREDSINLAGKIKTNSALSMSTTKKMVTDISNMNVDQALEYCINLNALSRSTEDFAEGLNSFLSKRK
jgi:methylglutaconyl-CoA hydratase